MKKLFWALMAVAIFANFIIVGCAKNEEDEPLPPENKEQVSPDNTDTTDTTTVIVANIGNNNEK